MTIIYPYNIDNADFPPCPLVQGGEQCQLSLHHSGNCQFATAPTVDMVNHPPHYTSDPSGVECIEITQHRNFNIGNAIKYLWRAGIKDDKRQIEDLEKAVFYIKDEIKRLKGVYGKGGN